MQFTVNVQDLMDGLRTVTRALVPRPAKQVLEGVLIDADDDCIHLTCSDGLLTIESTITAEVAEVGRVVMPGKLFTELCSKLPGGTVNIKINQNHQAAIRCASFRSNLSGMSADEYPEMPEIGEGVKLDIPQNRLRDMINHVIFAIATDESRQILTGCLMEVDAEEVRLVALDGFRLALERLKQPYTMPEGRELLRFIVPGRVMNEMSKIMADEEEPCSLLMARGHMEATFGNTRLASVLLAGDYIDYRRILPVEFKSRASVDRVTVQSAIDRASLMAREGKNNLIRMSFHENVVSVSSNAEMGDVQEECEAELNGDPINIAFNARYITDVIRNVSDEKLHLCFNSSVSPCVIEPQEGDRFLYLILPVRVFQ